MRIRGLLLLGLWACSDGLVSTGGTQHYDLTVNESTPPMQLRIESCRVDVDACPALCAAAARASSLPGQVMSCNVSFDSGQAYVSIDLGSFATGAGEPL